MDVDDDDNNKAKINIVYVCSIVKSMHVKWVFFFGTKMYQPKS